MLLCMKNIKMLYKNNKLNPIQDGPFRGCSLMDGSKKTSLLHKSYNDET